MRAIAIVIVLSACTEHGMSPTGGNPQADASTTPMIGCPNGHADKIKFAQQTSCANDGGVEFCIPDGDSTIQTVLSGISPNIRCAPGGGRAMCQATPGLLLCSYPTSFPSECMAPGGEMTAATWSDMCDIAGLSPVTEIVPTILD